MSEVFSYFYALEKLKLTQHDLAIGQGHIRSRLRGVFISHLLTLRDRDFPPNLQKDWQWISANLTKFGPLIHEHNGEVWMGSVEHTMRRIKNSTGQKIAERILYVLSVLESRT